mgnify:CR=1 FL=1
MLKYKTIFDNFDLKKFEDSVFSGKEHGWNAAYECCDRWVNSNKIALNWISSKSEFEKLNDYTMLNRTILRNIYKDKNPGNESINYWKEYIVDNIKYINNNTLDKNINNLFLFKKIDK